MTRCGKGDEIMGLVLDSCLVQALRAMIAVVTDWDWLGVLHRFILCTCRLGKNPSWLKLHTVWLTRARDAELVKVF